MNKIRVAVSSVGVCFRANVGKVRLADGRFFDTGLPVGFSDLFGVRKKDGKIFFIEVKTAKGRVREEQKNFIKIMKKNQAIAGIARTPEEAIELVMTGRNSSTDELKLDDPYNCDIPNVEASDGSK